MPRAALRSIIPSLHVDVLKKGRLPKISTDWAVKTSKQLLTFLGWRHAALSLFLVDDKEIRRWNRRYLNHDRPTDVIAFPQLTKTQVGKHRRQRKFSLPPVFLGDIIVSLQTAKRESVYYQKSLAYETAFYLCHGILHLMGYEDGTPAKKKKMFQIQAAALSEIKPG